MLRKSLRILVALFACGMIFGINANATMTSSAGMSIGESNAWMVDGQWGEVFNNPATLGKFKNTAYAENFDGVNMVGVVISPIEGLSICLPLGTTLGASSPWAWGGNAGTDAGFEFFNTIDPTTNGIFGGKATTAGTRTSTGAETFDLAAGTYDGSNNQAVISQQDVGAIISYDLAELSVGVILAYSDASNKYDASSTSTVGAPTFSVAIPIALSDVVEFNSSQTTIGVGVDYALSESMKAGVFFKTALYEMDNKYSAKSASITDLSTTDMEYKADGAQDMSFGVNFAMGLTEKAKLHVMADYSMINHSTVATSYVKDATGVVIDNTKDTYDKTASIIDLGLSAEINASKDTLCYVGVMARFTDAKFAFDGKDSTPGTTTPNLNNGLAPTFGVPVDVKQSSFAMPVFIGCESKLSENWTGRIGGSQLLFDSSSNEVTATGSLASAAKTKVVKAAVKNTDSTGSTTSLTYGLSYQMGNVKVDWNNSTDFLFNPGSIIGTAPSSFSTAVAISCNFDSLMSAK